VQVMRHHHRTPLATAPEEWVRFARLRWCSSGCCR
jgi:hypothetical protein